MFGYVVWVNRVVWKEWGTGVREMMPVLFTVGTVFVVRDCLLMSMGQIVRYDLGQIQLLIEN